VGLYRTLAPATSEFRHVTPLSGAWSYRKLSADTAELTLLQGDSDPTAVPSVRHLKVTTEAEGMFRGGPSAITIVGTNVSSLLNLLSFRLAAPGQPMALANCSSRSYVRAGTSAVMGFVVADHTRAVLVRAVGPGLARFGVVGAITDPHLSIIAGGQRETPITNDDWESVNQAYADAVDAACRVVGAFPLASRAKDSALVMLLEPGAYTAQVTGVSAAESGEVLIEVYPLP
jgi:hypothetical protein